MGTVFLIILALVGLSIASWLVVGLAVILGLLQLILPGWLVVLIGVIACAAFLLRKWL